MPSCVKLVDLLSKGRAQSSVLYSQSTNRYYNTRKLIRRTAVHKHSLTHASTQAPSLFSSVKYSYTRYPQALCMQINYRKLLV